jgi:16S rRNA A1518/A1519 N6-dimethyltransferase RsmA/KsgA/DIM1 with predicted DNA glycosylase/AP lyase activity
MAERPPFPNVQSDIKDLQRRMDEQTKNFHTVRQAFETRIATLEADIKALTARVEGQHPQAGAPRG